MKGYNSTNKELVDYLLKTGVVRSQIVYDTLLKVDRKYFVPRQPYYEDCPFSIGFGATISAPHMHAYALQYLAPSIQQANNVLDVGSGTGFLTLAMAIMSKPSAKIYGIEHVPELVASSIGNIKACNSPFEDKIIIKEGDGRKGWPDKSIKFDVIHVGAAPDKIPPELIEQLEDKGMMVIPVGGEHNTQQFLRIRKEKGEITKQKLNDVRYVPLTDLSYQLKR